MEKKESGMVQLSVVEAYTQWDKEGIFENANEKKRRARDPSPSRFGISTVPVSAGGGGASRGSVPRGRERQPSREGVERGDAQSAGREEEDGEAEAGKEGEEERAEADGREETQGQDI
eukprot:2147466-Rhodomonas_salina.1